MKKRFEIGLTAVRQSFMGKWRVMMGTPLTKQEITALLMASSIPSFGFYFLLTMSALIATMGLVANSSATIIGAMIIAPLKGPIDTLSYGLVRFNIKLIRRSLWTLSTGIVLTVLVAYLSSIVVGSRFAGSEVLARGNPNLLDLVVALAAGAAGAFSLTRPNISGAPAGVAIAVALVPPLCVVGIGLGMGEKLSSAQTSSIGELNLQWGASLLFFTNLVAIAFSGAIVFLAQFYSSMRRAAPGVLLSLVFMLAIAQPLNASMYEVLLQNRANAKISQIAPVYFPEWIDNIQSLSTRFAYRDGILFCYFYVSTPENLITQENIDILQQVLSNDLNVPVDISVFLLPFKTLVSHPDSLQLDIHNGE